jgi:hypothetical protein
MLRKLEKGHLIVSDNLIRVAVHHLKYTHEELSAARGSLKFAGLCFQNTRTLVEIY